MSSECLHLPSVDKGLAGEGPARGEFFSGGWKLEDGPKNALSPRRRLGPTAGVFECPPCSDRTRSSKPISLPLRHAGESLFTAKPKLKKGH